MGRRSLKLCAAAMGLAALSTLGVAAGHAAPRDSADFANRTAASSYDGYYDYAPGYEAGPAVVAPTPDYASPYFAAPADVWSPANPPGCGADRPHC
jgi:hypothetical protein